MPVLIKGKVIRNIPEQVSQNMKEIKALKTELYEKEYTIQDINIVGGHLIITTYGGEEIDAGAIKNIVSMSIDGSQHLIATYNDGSTQDLGAIFSGNVNISGDLTVAGDIAGDDVTGNSIIENMGLDYAFEEETITNHTIEPVYAGIVKNGNKLTIVYACNITKTASGTDTGIFGYFYVPSAVGAKLIPNQVGLYNWLAVQKVAVFKAATLSVDAYFRIEKYSNIKMALQINTDNFELNEKYYCRFEVTFLLSDSLAE